MLQFSILTIGTFVTMLDSISIFIGKACFKKDIKKIIPILSLVFGLILGICGYYTPNVEMGSNLVEAIFIGLSAGAAATGVNQVGKQMNKGEMINDITSNMICLKNFIESIEVPEDINSESLCTESESTENIPETNDENVSETHVETVLSTGDTYQCDANE